jgi:predicted GNAT family N-acyltransferase
MTDEDLSGLRVRVGEWSELGEACAAIRREVFVAEQGVPEAIEMDGKDDAALHVLARVGERSIGTGRLLADGKIGRMAVVKAFRSAGVGGAMLGLLLEEARERGTTKVYLNAQIGALRFYEEFGFETDGEEFVEAGLRHRRMELSLG